MQTLVLSLLGGDGLHPAGVSLSPVTFPVPLTEPELKTPAFGPQASFPASSSPIVLLSHCSR